MNSAEIKLDIFRKLDALQDSKLQQAYGLLLNFFNSQVDVCEEDEASEWDTMTQAQRDGILEADTQLKNGEGIPHEEVMSAMRKKFLND